MAKKLKRGSSRGRLAGGLLCLCHRKRGKEGRKEEKKEGLKEYYKSLRSTEAFFHAHGEAIPRGKNERSRESR